jgi:hypothetical protein
MVHERISESTNSILDIRFLSYNNETEIRSKVAQNKGRLTVLVHPFYHEHMEPDLYDQTLQYQHSNLMRDVLSSFTNPILLLEEKDKTDSTKLRMPTPTNRESIICIVPTFPDSPAPCVKKQKSKPSNWWDLVDKLESWGVKETEVGGRLLYYNCDNEPAGCVWFAAEWLKKSFKTKINPKLCYPDNY